MITHGMADSFKQITMAVMLVVSLGLTLICRSDAGTSAWPNEPAGSTLITDNPFDCITCNGWNVSFNTGVSIVTDATAPLSPSNVLQHRYATGFVGGSAPGVVYYGLPSNLREVYIGHWWKPSNPWHGHSSGINKTVFIWGGQPSGTGALVYFDMRGSTGAYHYEATMSTTTINNCHIGNGDCPGTRNFSANASSTVVTLGVWHRIEIYLKPSTTTSSKDGIMRWWVDGVLTGNYTTVNYQSDPWNEFQISPTWGGIGDTKIETDFFWWDHIRISSGGVLGLGDSTPPAAPTGLRAI